MLIGNNISTLPELIFTNCVLIFTVGVFAYIISKISIIIEEINKDSNEYKKDLEIINKYLNNKNVGKETKSKVRGYLDYLHLSSSDIKNTTAAIGVLDKLPKNIKNQVGVEINQIIIQNIPILYNNFSKSVIASLLKSMEEVTFITNEVISDKSNTSIYFILKGEVDLHVNPKYNNGKSFQFQKLQKGDIFGDKSFFTGYNCEYTAVSSTMVSVCKISRLAFLEILQINNQDFQIYTMIRDQLLFQFGLEMEKKYYKCNMCHSRLHSEMKCNLLAYNPKSDLVYLKSCQSQEHLKRSRYFRNRRPKFYALNEELQIDLEDIGERLYLYDEKFVEFSNQISSLDSNDSRLNESSESDGSRDFQYDPFDNQEQLNSCSIDPQNNEEMISQMSLRSQNTYNTQNKRNSLNINCTSNNNFNRNSNGNIKNYGQEKKLIEEYQNNQMGSMFDKMQKKMQLFKQKQPKSQIIRNDFDSQQLKFFKKILFSHHKPEHHSNFNKQSSLGSNNSNKNPQNTSFSSFQKIRSIRDNIQKETKETKGREVNRKNNQIVVEKEIENFTKDWVFCYYDNYWKLFMQMDRQLNWDKYFIKQNLDYQVIKFNNKRNRDFKKQFENIQNSAKNCKNRTTIPPKKN